MSIKPQNWCETRVKSTKCSFQWTINNFSHYNTEKIGFQLKSSIFYSDKNDKIKWYLGMYPKGQNDAAKDHISLYLCPQKNEAVSDAKTKYDLYFLNDKTEKINNFTTEHTFPKNDSQGWGYNKFVKKDFLFDTVNGLLKNDQLIVCCDLIEYENSVNTDGRNISIKYNHECQLSDDFEILFRSKELSDVIINVNGNEYHVHKAILAARSPVFAAMFNCNMNENIQNRIKINDMSEDVMQEMLRFIYTGKVPNLNQIVYDVFIAADKYDLKQLKIMCEDYVRADLCIDTAADILMMSDMLSAKQLKKIPIQYVRNNITEIGKTKGWKRMAIEHPQLMASLFSDSKK